MLKKQLRLLLEATGLNQRQFAERVGMDYHRLRNMTSGRVEKLTPDEARSLVQKLHVSGDWLATGQGAMFKTETEQRHGEILDVLRAATRAVTEINLPREQMIAARDVVVGVAEKNEALIRAAFERVEKERASLVADLALLEEVYLDVQRGVEGLRTTPEGMWALFIRFYRQALADRSKHVDPAEVKRVALKVVGGRGR